MKKTLFLLPLIFQILTAAVSTELFSKYNINYGDLLVDQGKYLEAVDAYDSAFEATEVDKLKIEAMIREANVLSLYLDESNLALKIYKKIYSKFPQRKEAEFALYQAGMLAKEMQSKEAINLFDEYLRKYRGGKFYFQVKFLRDKFNTYTPPAKKPKEEFLPTYKDGVNIRVALHKKIQKVTFSGDLIVENQRYSNVQCYFQNKQIIFNNRAYKELIIQSNSPIKLDSKKYKYSGSMKLLAKDNGIRVINIVDIENYIYGVVTSESPASWHLEALKSQAIAARTYVYYQSRVRANWDYDVVDSTGDQVYKGLNGKHKKGVSATDGTRGIIITYQNKPILSQYTANSGWKSASSKEIFGVNKHYLYGHKDDFSVKMPLGTWDKKMSLQEIETGLNKKGIKIGKLYEIKSAQVGPSGRILKVTFVGSNGEKTLKTYSSLRRIVGLKDILTTIERKGDMFYFNGGGFGHGVGYSQWGGQAMAKAGYKHRDILKYYYKDVSFSSLF